MKYKAIIFDFDGVLNDTEGIKFKVWQKIAAEFDKKINKKFYIQNCCGRSRESIAKILCKKYKIPLKQKEFAKLMHEASISLLKKDMRPIKTNIAFLKKSYKVFDGKVGIASSQERGILMDSLKRLKITKFANEVISGDDIKHMKPAPDIYLKACKRLKVKPKDCIVIEDSQAGTEAAYNAGIRKIIAIPRAFTKYQDFSKAHIVVRKSKSLNNLPQLLQSKNQ